MWGGRVGGRSFFGNGQYTGNIMQGGAALQPQDYMLDGVTPLRRCIVVTGAATVAPSAETGASVVMGRNVVVDGAVATLAPSTASKGLIMLFRSGIYCRNGGRIHVDGLGKAGAFGNLTPYSLIPVRLRASIAPRRHAQFVLSAAGAAGGIRASRDEGVYVAGHAGAAAGTMQTGGGGGGAVNTLPGDFGGAGGAGGPLCGGAASGGGHNAGGGAISADAGAYGGPGTKGRGVSATYSASSGAGNPPGGADTYCEAALLGGGGLLALFSPAIDIDSGCICSADGAQGGLMASPGYWHFPGGSAGGGLVCAATRPGGWRNRGTVRALGGAAVPGCQGLYNGGPGGAGSVNIFEV